MRYNLMPCPLCGSHQHIKFESTYFDGLWWNPAVIQCTKCNLVVKGEIYEGNNAEQTAQISNTMTVDLWNNRGVK